MDTPDADAKGIGFLQEAVTLEPSNPSGWGRLALAFTRATEYAPADRTAALVFRAQDAAQRALELDPRNADARASLALLPPHFGEWHAAEDRLAGVLADHPRHLITRDARDFLHSAVGRTREASQSRIAYAREEPLHARIQYRLVYAYWNLGWIGDADRAGERALQLWPRHPGVWFSRLWTLAFTGRADRALRLVDDTAGQPPMPPAYRDLLRVSLQALASRTSATTATATTALLAALETSPAVAINAVMTLSDLGELDVAYAIADAYLLERGPLLASVRWREGQMSINDQTRRKTHMLFVPATASMRKDQRFKRLTEDVGLARYWRDSNSAPDYLREA